jgi:hypothetical protein
MANIVELTLEALAFALILAAVVAFWCVTPANAQTRSYYGADGSYQGRAYTNGDSTTYYGANGSYQGQSYTSGGTTRYYNSNGAFAGQRYNGY